jgi:hypothetical protein
VCQCTGQGAGTPPMIHGWRGGEGGGGLAAEEGGGDRIAGVDKGVGIDEDSHGVHEAPLSRQVQRFLRPRHAHMVRREGLGMCAAMLRLPRRAWRAPAVDSRSASTCWAFAVSTAGGACGRAQAALAHDDAMPTHPTPPTKVSKTGPGLTPSQYLTPIPLPAPAPPLTSLPVPPTHCNPPISRNRVMA